MELFYRDIGKGFPVIILHGLYGSSDNWVSIANRLGEYYRIILVDQRNHGNSPHDISHTYSDLADDLYLTVRKLELQKFFLIGHSMGGRAAMQFQTLYPNFVEKLIVVDVAPWSYSGNNPWFRKSFNEHKSIIQGMLNLPLANLQSRVEADRELSIQIPAEKLRQFLFKNLKRDKNGRFFWSINLSALEKNLEGMILGVDVDVRVVQDLDILFIRGGESDYIPNERLAEINEIYPKAQCVTIDKVGHWLHAEQPEEFIKVVLGFLSKP